MQNAQRDTTNFAIINSEISLLAEVSHDEAKMRDRREKVYYKKRG